MRTLLVVGIWILVGSSLLAQCPVANFASPALACSGQNIYVQNLTTGATSYEWDFCSGDLALTPTASIAASSNLLFRTRSMRVAHDSNSNLWYGFTIDQANSPYRLIRFNFGNSLSNDPSVIDLGNPSNALNSAFDLQLYKEGSNWYGLVANSGVNSLLLLSFGTDLGSAPTVQNLGSFGVLDTPDGIFLVVENGILSAFVTNGGSVSEIVKLTFGSSILNTPTVISFPVAGGSALRGIAMIRECDRWFGLVTSYGNGKVFWLDFTNGLTQSPQSGEINFFTSYNFPTNIVLALDGSEYLAFIQSALGEQYRLSFGSSIIDKAGNGQNLGNFGISNENSALELVKVKSDWFGFSIDLTNRKLVRQTFPSICDASTATSISQNPSQVSFTVSGTKKISLTGISSSGAISSQSKTITISPSIAPDIAFSSANVCANNNVNFTAQSTSGNITSYAWSFGDTNTSPLPNPSNIYATAGTYPVALQVTASNGCINTTKSDLVIYNPPVADFSLPSASPFCTNQNYVFSNQSTFDVASSPTWEWRLNGTLVSGTQNLTQPFATSSAQEVRLKVKIPGCENEIIKNVSTVLPGPLANFIFANGCQATSVPFTNTTSGTVTSYSWNFGDGNMSSSPNAANTFTNIGPYNVTLQANNAAGCQNSVTKLITVYSKPQPDFSIGLPPFSCSGSSSQFTDLTPSPTDSNIASYTWSFGDAANGASTFKNPTYTYSTANNYNVSLLVTTNFGCTNSIQKSMTIAQSPVASFTSLPACVNQSTQFTDASTGNIKSRLWQIQSNTFTSPNPQFTFSGSGSFPVLLTVTGNNNCVSQLSKNISVPVASSLDFSVQAPCVKNTTVFTEVTTNTDPPVLQSWAFGSLATGAGSPAQFSFPSPASYSVRLTSTRQSGCAYSISKSVPIGTSPTADFSPSVDAGAAPLSVDFSNSSTAASSYQWKFGDKNNSISSQTNPSFVFTELGSFNVELTATNSAGCVDRLIKVINVVVPRIDLAMKDFYLTTDASNALQPVVTIVNKSNISIKDPVILVDVTGGSLVKKKIIGILKPNQELTQMLDFQLVPQLIRYVCAEVEAVGDVDLFQNRKCLSLQGDEIVFAPFPNPAKAELNLDWINVDGGTVNFQIFNSKGSVCLEQSVTNLSAGINRLVVNTSGLSSGVYLIRFSDNKTTQSYRFFVVGN
jgi:PKD repeat protein